MEAAKTWALALLHSRVEHWLAGGVYIVGILIVMRLAQKAALAGTEWSINRVDSSDALKFGFLPLIRHLITIFVFLSGSITILKHFNYDAMSLVTALGVSSLAVGLAAKDTLSNMISGFILIIDRNLRPGDQVRLNNFSGKVREIGLRSTRLSMNDGNTLIVPNTDLVNTKILNLTLFSQEKACATQIHVPLALPFLSIREDVLTLLEQIPMVSKNKPRTVHLMSLADGFQSIQISFWVHRLEDIDFCTSQVNEGLLLKFQQNEITLCEIASSVCPKRYI